MEGVKPDKTDKSERLNYLRGEKAKQEKRKDFYSQQLSEIQEMLEANKKEIRYNEGWSKFHEEAIKGHQKVINETFDLNEKEDQEKKLEFHKIQIKEHHKKNVEYHQKEIKSIKKEIELFEEGIKRCEEQLGFLGKKIEENII